MVGELRQKWIAALRSGDYKQCQKALARTDGSYCCLGVLLEQTGHTEWVTPEVLGFSDKLFNADPNAGAYGLTELDRKAVGLGNRELSDLIDMNDVQGANFNQIADYIERLPFLNIEAS